MRTTSQIPRIGVAAGSLLVVIGSWTINAQTISQLCPPCAAVDQAQKPQDDLAPEVLADRSWAIGARGINSAAWQASRGASYLLGTGATILQIDTGITQHPLLPPLIGDSGVDFKGADNFFGVGYSNEDPLLSGLLRFPGHGTKTSSVITATMPSLGQWQFPTDGERMRGAAPGVRLIPLRGTQGVLLIPGRLGELDTEPWRIANALNQAALGAKGLFRRRIDVVSMSLGSWPETQGLCDSVERATKAGVIVIAAAGNEIKRTKYPAKCPTAIAVAGSNYQQRPWAGSAGSAEVAVAAPAEGVWTASVVAGTFCMEASYGTSFATALVASIAAEWVALRREKETMPADPVGTIASPGPFRAALMKTARPWSGPDAAKWRQSFGTGIADLSQLMRAEAGNVDR